MQFVKGMDLSGLPQVEACGGRFYDGESAEDAVRILKRCGMNLVRLRLFVDPRSSAGEPYGAGNTDLTCVLAMAKRLKAQGLPWLLDFHYSDCWADPGKQIPPKAWQEQSLPELTETVYHYTGEVLRTMRREGVLPAMAAPGNELTNGMLWPVGRVCPPVGAGTDGTEGSFAALAQLISAGIRAVREEAPEAEVMLHLDNGGNQALYRWWFDSYREAGGADFDVIGLSYYPFWHGSLEDLESNMRALAERFGKPMIVAETSIGFTLRDYADYEKLPTSKRKGMAAGEELAKRVPFPMTPGGQADFLQELMERIAGIPRGLGRGLIWWEPCLLPLPGTDWATEAGIAYMHERGPGGNEWANQALFDYDGHALPALSVLRHFAPD